MIDVGDADVREHCLREIEAKKLTFSCGGQTLKVQRAHTDSAKNRNTALREAATKLRKEKGVSEKDVELDWKERVVKVSGEIAFKQPSGRALGEFGGKFSQLKLP